MGISFFCLCEKSILPGRESPVVEQLEENGSLGLVGGTQGHEGRGDRLSRLGSYSRPQH